MKKPVFVKYELNRREAVRLVCISHSDDRNADVLEIHLTQGGEQLDVSGAEVTARIVSKKDKILLADDVVCTVNAEGNLMVPFDNAVIPSQGRDLFVEVSVAKNGEVLTLPFPLWVRVNGSVLDGAEISEHSKGTVAQLLEDALECLEEAKEIAKGAKGDKGDKGDPGDDYVLTNADKQEIAQLAIAALDGNGVAY